MARRAGTPKGRAAGTLAWPARDVRIVRATRSEVVTEARWDADRLTCRWRRTIRLLARSMRIDDTIAASRPVIVRQLFHIATSDVTLRDDGRAAEINLRSGVAHLRQADEGRAHTAAYQLTYRPGIDRCNAPTYWAELARNLRGKRLRFATMIELTTATSM